VTAFGVQQRQLRGNLDAASAALIERSVQHIGADILVAAFDEREVSLGTIERFQAGAVSQGCGALQIRRQIHAPIALS
jgi:hypothetical protein